jgi:hypothetical protein
MPRLVGAVHLRQERWLLIGDAVQVREYCDECPPDYLHPQLEVLTLAFRQPSVPL